MERPAYDLFRVDRTCCHGRVFRPRVPINNLTEFGREDSTTERVCFATTINGALSAVEADVGSTWYVHTPFISRPRSMVPSEQQVPDMSVTGEVWVLQPVPLVCIGRIRVVDFCSATTDALTLKDMLVTYRNFRYEWDPTFETPPDPKPDGVTMSRWMAYYTWPPATREEPN